MEKVCHCGIFSHKINEDLKYIYMIFLFCLSTPACTHVLSKQSITNHNYTFTENTGTRNVKLHTPALSFDLKTVSSNLKEKRTNKFLACFFFCLFSKTEVGCVGSSEGRSVSRKKLL